jgi:hypothetical protein
VSLSGTVSTYQCVHYLYQQQYITVFLALQDTFLAPVELDSISDFSFKAENSGKDMPANQNVLLKDVQVRNDFEVSELIC